MSRLVVYEKTSSEGITEDFLKYSGVKEHAKRYVTSVMDLLYKLEDLLAIQTADLLKDERYLLLNGGFRSWVIPPTLIIIFLRGRTK